MVSSIEGGPCVGAFLAVLDHGVEAFGGMWRRQGLVPAPADLESGILGVHRHQRILPGHSRREKACRGVDLRRPFARVYLRIGRFRM